MVNGARRTSRENTRIVARDLPFEAENILYKLVWHKRAHAHPAHQWFCALVANTCRAQKKKPSSRANARQGKARP
jgi:DNA-binding transcriptional LysR family regulator